MDSIVSQFNILNNLISLRTNLKDNILPENPKKRISTNNTNPLRPL